MCCGRAGNVGPTIVQNPSSPLPALPRDTPIKTSLNLLRYVGTTPAADLAGVPTNAKYRLRDDKTVTVNALDTPYLMAKKDTSDAYVFERLA